MSLHELQLAHEALDVSINSLTGFGAVLTDGAVEIFSQNPHKKKGLPVRRGSISTSTVEGQLLQITAADDGRLFLLAHDRENISRVYISHIVGNEAVEDLSWEVCDTGELAVSSIFCGLNRELVCGEAHNGELYDLSSSPNRSPSIGKLQEFCPWVEVVNVGSKVRNQPAMSTSLTNSQITVFGLSSKGSLYAADQLLASNCTSFVATPAHLIFTTANHLLKFIHLSEDKGMLFYMNQISC
jgi:elongator complex protein 1